MRCWIAVVTAACLSCSDEPTSAGNTGTVPDAGSTEADAQLGGDTTDDGNATDAAVQPDSSTPPDSGCQSAQHCPQPAKACMVSTCASGQCGTAPAPDGAACAKDGAPCLVGKCAASGCVVEGVKASHCAIAGSDGTVTCAESGGLAIGKPCLACAPNIDQSKWSARGAGQPCPEDGVACTVDACDGKGACTHTPDDGACSSKSTSCAAGSCDPAFGCAAIALPKTVTCDGADGIPCTVEHCDGQGKCDPKGAPDDKAGCDDKIACTLDVCEPTAGDKDKLGCKHKFDNAHILKTCNDGSVCTDDACKPDESKGPSGCTHKPNNNQCDADDIKCTDDACSAGACKATLQAGHCLIGDACHLAGAATADTCATCEPKTSDSQWTPKALGTKCTDDGTACTIDACDGKGQCDHGAVQADTCLLAGKCVAKGGKDKAGCSQCAPLTSQVKWTALAKGETCPDDGTACTLDLCDGGGKCEHGQVAKDSCLIDGKCRKTGEKAAAGCVACEPGASQVAWTNVKKGSACDADPYSCTVDSCDGGGKCLHEPDHGQCDDKVACTWDACEPSNQWVDKASKTGCANIDKCPWGHACDQAKDACLTAKPVALVEQSQADPTPTNPAVARHVLDVKKGLSRTWVAYMSQPCAVASGGKWSVKQGAELRAVVLDDQVAPVGKKAKPPVVTFAGHFAGGAAKGVCQGFPVVSGDPQSSSQAWVHWLEVDTAKGASGGCLENDGVGGVLRFALLDTSSANDGAKWTKASGSVCAVSGSNVPQFLAPGFALLDAAGAGVGDPGKRQFLSVRPNVFKLNVNAGNQLVGLGTASKLAWSKAGPGSGEFSQVHPVIVDTLAKGAGKARYFVLALSEDSGARRLWALPLDEKGAKLPAQDWLDSAKGVGKTFFAGVTAVCSLSASVDDNGHTGVAIALRKGGSDELWMVRRTSAAVVVADLLKKGEGGNPACGAGIASAVSVPSTSGFRVIHLRATGGTSPGRLFHQLVTSSIGAASVAMDEKVSDSDLGAVSLAWRGIAAVRTGPSAHTYVTEGEDGSKRVIRALAVSK